MATALFAGTFDPVTFGHLDMIRRARDLFGNVVVAVGTRASKSTLFTPDERVALVRGAVESLDGVKVERFDGLLVEFAKSAGATILLRGVRTTLDFEYEQQMAQTNRFLSPGIETVILVPSPETAMISSTLVREIVAAGGSVDRFVPTNVVTALANRDA